MEEQRQRATLHGGRCIIKNGKSTGKAYSSKHADRNFNVQNASHITPELVSQNLYFVADEDGNVKAKDRDDSFEKHELRMYQRYFSDWLEKQNERHRKGGHSSRERTMEAVYKSARQAPREEILCIGNRDDRCQDDDAFVQVVSEYVHELKTKYPAVRILDYSIHKDEEASNIHAHLRMCFVHTNASGDYEPNQTQALAEMGIESPNPDKKEDKSNNRLITFSQQCREMYVAIAEQHGFSIAVEPASPGKITLNKQEFITQKLREENEALTMERASLIHENQNLEEQQTALRAENAEMVQERTKLRKQVDKLTAENNCLRATVERLKRFIHPIKQFFARLASIKIADGRSALDELLLNANFTPAYDALKELDNER